MLVLFCHGCIIIRFYGALSPPPPSSPLLLASIFMVVAKSSLSFLGDDLISSDRTRERKRVIKNKLFY
jgi:hypothetical protein